jgi:hypothetical protein
MRVMPGILSQSDVRYLPIVAAFVKKIGVAEVNPQLRGADLRGFIFISRFVERWIRY